MKIQTFAVRSLVALLFVAQGAFASDQLSYFHRQIKPYQAPYLAIGTDGVQ